MKTLHKSARSYKNTIVFIDEIDGLVVQREDDDTPDTRRILAELLAHVTATIKQDEYMGELVAHLNECSVLPKKLGGGKMRGTARAYWAC